MRNEIIGSWEAEDRKLIVKKICNQRKTRLSSSRVFLFSGFPPLPSLGQALRGNDGYCIYLKLIVLLSFPRGLCRT